MPSGASHVSKCLKLSLIWLPYFAGLWDGLCAVWKPAVAVVWHDTHAFSPCPLILLFSPISRSVAFRPRPIIFSRASKKTREDTKPPLVTLRHFLYGREWEGSGPMCILPRYVGPGFRLHW
ncbi:hypothetical protein GGS20DRAFT_565818 [Poronia punctata]|nr:hypothetical protein GGS20DRAFT_565818 [Poronia punctata]